MEIGCHSVFVGTFSSTILCDLERFYYTATWIFNWAQTHRIRKDWASLLRASLFWIIHLDGFEAKETWNCNISTLLLFYFRILHADIELVYTLCAETPLELFRHFLYFAIVKVCFFLSLFCSSSSLSIQMTFISMSRRSFFISFFSRWSDAFPAFRRHFFLPDFHSKWYVNYVFFSPFHTGHIYIGAWKSPLSQKYTFHPIHLKVKEEAAKREIHSQISWY